MGGIVDVFESVVDAVVDTAESVADAVVDVADTVADTVIDVVIMRWQICALDLRPIGRT
jgi:hypothetical protein